MRSAGFPGHTTLQRTTRKNVQIIDQSIYNISRGMDGICQLCGWIVNIVVGMKYLSIVRLVSGTKKASKVDCLILQVDDEAA